MAELPFLDSAGHYNTSTVNMKWTTGNGTILPTSGRDGNAAHLSSSLMKTFLNEYASLTLGCAYNNGAFPAVLQQFRNYRCGAPNILDVTIIADGRLKLSSSYGTVDILVPGFVFNFNTWNFVEIGLVITTVSTFPVITCEVHIDNAVIATGLVFSGAGIAVGTNGIPSTGLKVASFFSNVNTGVGDLSCDLYVTDGEFFGDTSCRAYFPRQDGTFTDGIPSTPGPHYLMVKEHVPDLGSTTIELANVNDKDSYYMDMITAFTTVFAAQFLWCAVKTEAGISSFQGTLTDASADTQLTPETFYPAFSIYLYFISAYRKSPHTAADWTVSELNGQMVGEKRIT